MAKPTLIILGASARAAAGSAIRAGYAPRCADLFADADLQRACPVQRVAMEDYPKGLIAAAKSAPPGPWMYTGALENRPDIVAKVDRPLWGNPPEVLRRVRSPRLVRDCLVRHGLPCPEIAGAEPDPQRKWLVKPYRGAGGQGIRYRRRGDSVGGRKHYLQEWIDGVSHSVIYLAQPLGPTLLLGMTQQLVGEPSLRAAPFHYCGSIGPVTPSAATLPLLLRIGQRISEDFGLRGLFGVDFILKQHVPWLIEVNPRYTASVEVLERATGRALLEMHAQAFAELQESGSRSGTRESSEKPRNSHEFRYNADPALTTVWPRIGKFILFARAALTFPDHGLWDSDDAPLACADIPNPGAPLAKGQPILTFFGGGDELKENVAKLERDVYG